MKDLLLKGLIGLSILGATAINLDFSEYAGYPTQHSVIPPVELDESNDEVQIQGYPTQH